MLGEGLVQLHSDFWPKPRAHRYWKDTIPEPSRQGVARHLLFFFMVRGKQRTSALQQKDCRYLVLSL